MVLKNGEDITKIAYKIIIARVIQSLPKKLSILDASLKYLDKNPINLSVIIANIGECSTVFDLACKSRGIPSYLIINGILGPRFSDESKHATYINSYSEIIKNNYFKDLSNIIVLGDPRMDDYANLLKKSINRVSPTVVIGASGYSPVDLNSYVAIEFDFMHDVLEALDAVKKTGIDLKVVIKVRPNGYLQQYKRFVSKYFPDLVNNVTAIRTIRQVLTKADLYISINSQTLFEASCIGIPVIYYKIDNEVMPPPFDFNQDLVTVCSVAHLIDAVHLFIADSPIYKIFLNRKIMEKYIGFIDGDNLERNINFIKKLTKHKVE
jgi:CDP-glycerol glycerophosphotransferase (TagB/SpsB family)